MRTSLALILTFLALAMIVRAEESIRIPERLSTEFQKKIVAAITAYKQKDFARAEVLVAEANAIQPDTLAATNLMGAIKLDQGDTAEAAALFQKALDKDPTFYPAKFNLAEIPFQEKDYDKARSMFEGLAAENPKDELAQFKIFLTYLLQKNMEKARSILDGLPWPGNTPSFYFSHAAWEYAHRNVSDAEGWISSAADIFPPSANAIYAETLEELGWLKLKAAAPSEPAVDVPGQ